MVYSEEVTRIDDKKYMFNLEEEESMVKGLVLLPSNTTIRCFRLAGLERDIHVLSKAAGVRELYTSVSSGRRWRLCCTEEHELRFPH